MVFSKNSRSVFILHWQNLSSTSVIPTASLPTEVSSTSELTVPPLDREKFDF